MKNLLILSVILATAIATALPTFATDCGPNGCVPGFGKEQPVVLAQAQPNPVKASTSPKKHEGKIRRVQSPRLAQAAGVPPSAPTGLYRHKPIRRDAAWRTAELAKKGYFISWSQKKLPDGSLELYTDPDKFDIVANDKELLKKAATDVHDSAASKYGRGNFRVDPDPRLQPQLQRQMHRERRKNFESDVLTVTRVKEATTLKEATKAEQQAE